MSTKTIEVVARDGARAEIALHGGQVLSWRCANDPVERLYVSPKAEFRPGASIRGGIPVCFPQFAGRGPLVKHGFARTSAWQLHEHSQRPDGAAVARLSLSSHDETLALWPYPFRATLDVVVIADRLEVGLLIQNTGSAPFSFTGALHTYLAVPDVAETRVEGLAGLTYCDTAKAGETRVEAEPAVAFGAEVDRIYTGATSPVDLRAPGLHMRIGASGFTDTVVWNPGPDVARAMADLPRGGWRHFVCVEAAAALAPVGVGVGACWSGRQTLDLVRGQAA